MMEILAAIGGSGTLLFGIAFVTLAFLNRKDSRELHAARDRIEKLDEQHDGVVKERDDLVLKLAAKTEEHRKEKALRIDVEAQRDNAFAIMRDRIVEYMKKAKVADANRVISDLLAMRLGVPQAVPAGRAASPGPDDLERP